MRHRDKVTVSSSFPEPQNCKRRGQGRAEQQHSRSGGAPRRGASRPGTPQHPAGARGTRTMLLGAPSQGYGAAPLRLLPYLCCGADSGSSCGLYF